MLRAIFCRVGSKRSILEEVLALIPDHNTYIEPFVGSGVVFWNKPSAKKSIINDKDKDLIKAYRLIKKTSPDMARYPDVDNLTKQRIFFEKTPTSTEDKLIWLILKFCNTFGSRGKPPLLKGSNPLTKIKNIQKYKDKLKNTTITSTDYLETIKKYDSPTSFFYLDPPYEKSASGLYEIFKMTFEEFGDSIKKIKGKWLLSINDSPNIRRIFKDFKTRSISAGGGSNAGFGSVVRKELLISNF